MVGSVVVVAVVVGKVDVVDAVVVAVVVGKVDVVDAVVVRGVVVVVVVVVSGAEITKEYIDYSL